MLRKKRYVMSMLILLLAISLLIPYVHAETTDIIEIEDESHDLMSLTYPMSIYYEPQNSTFFVYQAYDVSTLKYYAKTFNHTTDTLSSAFEIGTAYADDPHYSPAIGYLWNGSLIVFYDSHSYTPGFIKYRVSNGAWNTQAWYSYKTYAGPFTYPQPVSYSDQLQLFIRYSYGAWDCVWYRYTFNSTGFWLDPVVIVTHYDPGDGGTWYMLFNKDSNDYIYASGSLSITDTGRRDLYFAYSKDRGYTWKKADETPLSLPLGDNMYIGESEHYTTSTFSFNGPDNKPRVIAIQGTVTGDYVTRLRYGVWNGSGWEIDYLQDETLNDINVTKSGFQDWGGYPTAYGLAPFRRAVTNDVAFWFTHNETRKLTLYIGYDETNFIFNRTYTTDITSHYCWSYATENQANPFGSFVCVDLIPETNRTLYYVYNQMYIPPSESEQLYNVTIKWYMDRMTMWIGLGGLFVILIAPIMAFLNAKDHDLDKAFLWLMCILVIGIPLLIAWLWG